MSEISLKENKSTFQKDEKNYYVANMERLLKDFRETNEMAEKYMVEKYGEAIAKEVAKKAPEIFERLLPDMPDIGGKRNLLIDNFVIAAHYVAFYRPMKNLGLTAVDLGRMMYDLDEMYISSYQPSSSGSGSDSQENSGQRSYESITKAWKDWADWTLERKYPENFVAVFRQGNGSDFDFGFDISECAFCKYLHAHAMDELAPYPCLYDFIASRAFGTGLVRNKTISMGDDICEFRYKHGRPVTQSWETEIPKIQEMGLK